MKSIKELCLSLVKAESEDEVISILQKENYWDNDRYWVNLGGFENNFSIIGNQQSLPESALVEKIINSIDALLIQKCLLTGIEPDDKEKAPKSICEAVEKFFHIQTGNLTRLSSTDRSRLAANICLVATGSKKRPCYSIIDRGEGQTPKDMPDTFLSIAIGKSNKARIPFVQGKFKMGGTGSFQFCGENNIQFILTKRDPQLALSKRDDTAEMWGFTIIRRKNPEGLMRSSTYQYLAPNDKILSFKENELPLLPGEYPNPYIEKMNYGTYVKLYDYQIGRGLNTNIKFDLYNRLSLLIPNIALPVRVFERRSGYTGHSFEATMAGLSVRLEEDKRNNLEENFPTSAPLTIKGQKVKSSIYAFKPEQAEKYRKNEGILFTINGQTHGAISIDFFRRKNVGMSYLADSLLLILDCSEIDGRTREDLFMNSRDRLRETALKGEIEDVLAGLISTHAGLRELREKRRREEIENRIGDAKPLVDVLNDVIKRSPSLASLLIPGTKITNPFKTKKVKEKETRFEGKEYPSFFKLKGQIPLTKMCPINQRFRIQFETDVVNDYFDREQYAGEHNLTINGDQCEDYVLNLWNGLATMTVKLPQSAKIEDKLSIKSEVSGPLQTKTFENSFVVVVEQPITPHRGTSGKRHNPPEEEDGEDRETPTMLTIPPVTEIYEANWGDKWTKFSALKIKDNGEDSFDFFVNMDNVFLLQEIKQNSKTDPSLIKAKFKFALVLIGLALLKAKFTSENGGNGVDIEKRVAESTEAIAPVILPMISALGELEIEE